MNLREVQEATGGELSGGGAVFNSVSIDSRTMRPDELFIAIRGDHFDGHRFVAEAARKGAAAAIVSEDVAVELPTLKVPDTRLALGQLGAMNRAGSRAWVIALTGSQGKTTVKEMTARILTCRGSVARTEGNLNNAYGVPLSLLSITAHHDFAVLELGASGPGEIAYTAALTDPHIGHITNIGPAHLEGFGSVDGVARAKGELWQCIGPGGAAVINADDPYAEDFRKLAAKKKIVNISAAGDQRAAYYLQDVRLDSLTSVSFRLCTPAGDCQLKLPLPGRHNAANALAAAALSMAAAATLENVAMGLEDMLPVAGRFCQLRGRNGATLIDDSYNASPTSFRAAIDAVCLRPGRRIILMGDMKELGGEAEAAHQDLGLYARRQGIHCLYAVGELSRLTAEAFGAGGFCMPEREEAAAQVAAQLEEGVTLLVKGSRSEGMEKLVEQLREDEG